MLKMEDLSKLRVKWLRPDLVRTPWGEQVQVVCFDCGNTCLEIYLGPDSLLLICRRCNKFLSMDYEVASMLAQTKAPGEA